MYDRMALRGSYNSHLLYSSKSNPVIQVSLTAVNNFPIIYLLSCCQVRLQSLPILASNTPLLHGPPEIKRTRLAPPSVHEIFHDSATLYLTLLLTMVSIRL